jgi:hypothetical protein
VKLDELKALEAAATPPLDQLRQSRVNFDLFCFRHPIIREDPIMNLAREQLADAIERLEAAVKNANTLSQEPHHV